MITPKGKKSMLRVGLTYIATAIILIVGGAVGLLIWGYYYPAFELLIMWLILLITVISVYFLVLRGVFLNMWSGYSLDDKFFVIIDGYPNVKEICIPVKCVSEIQVKKVKGLFKFGLGKMVFYADGKKYSLKNVKINELERLKEELEKAQALTEDKREFIEKEKKQ